MSKSQEPTEIGTRVETKLDSRKIFEWSDIGLTRHRVKILLSGRDVLWTELQTGHHRKAHSLERNREQIVSQYSSPTNERTKLSIRITHKSA